MVRIKTFIIGLLLGTSVLHGIYTGVAAQTAAGRRRRLHRTGTGHHLSQAGCRGRRSRGTGARAARLR